MKAPRVPSAVRIVQVAEAECSACRTPPVPPDILLLSGLLIALGALGEAAVGLCGHHVGVFSHMHTSRGGVRRVVLQGPTGEAS